MKRKMLNYQIVTLCGSLKFKDVFDKIEKKLIDDGYIVLTPMYDNYLNLDIETLHKVHDNKMSISDFIVLIDVDGYVGKNTQREIDFCKTNNINIISYRDISNFERPTVTCNINK